MRPAAAAHVALRRIEWHTGLRKDARARTTHAAQHFTPFQT